MCKLVLPAVKTTRGRIGSHEFHAEAANRKLADAAACKDAWVWLQVRSLIQIIQTDRVRHCAEAWLTLHAIGYTLLIPWMLPGSSLPMCVCLLSPSGYKEHRKAGVFQLHHPGSGCHLMQGCMQSPVRTVPMLLVAHLPSVPACFGSIRRRTQKQAPKGACGPFGCSYGCRGTCRVLAGALRMLQAHAEGGLMASCGAGACCGTALEAWR